MLNPHHPMLVNADSINDQNSTAVTTEVAPGVRKTTWVRARHMGIPTPITRFKLAWGVFTGKYDALEWTEQ